MKQSGYLFSLALICAGMGINAQALTPVVVSSAAQLQSALSAAKGGEVISLASGNYGAVTISNKAYASPVTIMSQVANGAVFTGLTLKNSSKLNLSGMAVNFPASANYGLRLDGVDSLVVDGLYIYGADFMGGKAISLFNVSNLSILNSYISHTNDGIYSSGKMLNVLIEGNQIIARNGKIAASAHPDGMQLRSGPLQNLKIIRNVIMNSSQNIFQQSVGTAPWEDIVISGNVSLLIDRGASYAGKHIFLNAVKNVTIEGNTMATYDHAFPAVSSHGIRASVSGTYQVRDNIMSNASYSSVAPVSDHNLFYSTGKAIILTYTTLKAYQAAFPGKESGSLQANPNFKSLATGDVHLNSASAAIDAGVALQSLTAVDLDGASRLQGSSWDIGAFEF